MRGHFRVRAQWVVDGDVKREFEIYAKTLLRACRSLRELFEDVWQDAWLDRER